MDEAARAYVGALETRIAALTRAKTEFVAGTPGAVASVRRLLRMMRTTALTGGYPRLAMLAEAAEGAGDADLPPALDALVAAMQSVAKAGAYDTEPVVVLVVEDNAVIQSLVQKVLEGGSWRIVPAATIADAETILERERVTMVILDLVLPDGDGRNFLVRLREDARSAAMPVIVVSALENAQVRSECYALGCDAYLAKPIDLDILNSTAASLVGRVTRQLRESRTDPLTGLANRASIRDAIAELATPAGGEQSAVALVDCDHFRLVKERLGRSGGDAVLKAFAEFVRAALRPADIAGRWGGEEFVLLLPATSVETAAAALTNMQLRLTALALAPDDPDVRIAFSAGVAPIGGGIPVADALTEAERLLFHGKATGRGAVVTTTEQATPGVRTVLLAEDDPVIAALVRHRLERDGYKLEHAANGDDALERARSGGMALIISDVNMPGLSGFDLLKKLRELPATARTPIMMLTSMGNEADIARALSLGANDYVVKPFSPVELLARVRRLVARA